MTNAFEKIFPDSKILHCWNHIKRDVQYWLRKHGASNDEIAIYLQDIIRLLHSDSQKHLAELSLELCEKWSKAMVDYYQSEIKFVVEPLGLYDPYSGVTNNVSKSMNDLIKDLMKWKDVPVDVMVMCLQQLQNYFLSEIRRSFAAIGNYTLNKDYESVACDPEELVLPKNICDPKDIVQHIKSLV